MFTFLTQLTSDALSLGTNIFPDLSMHNCVHVKDMNKPINLTILSAVAYSLHFFTISKYGTYT